MNAKFEKWLEDNWPVTAERCKTKPYGDPWSTIKNCAAESWKASRLDAIQSLEVTQELVEIGFSATDQLSRVTRRDIDQALTTVLSALKEQAK